MDVVLGEMTLSGDEGYKEDAVITLKVGEKVTVKFADTDGEVVVDYNDRALTVTAEPEDHAGRCGTIYEEVWRHPARLPEGGAEPDPPVPGVVEIEYALAKGRQIGPLALEGVYFPLRERPSAPEILDDGMGGITVNINERYAFVEAEEEHYARLLAELLHEFEFLMVTQELKCLIQEKVHYILNVAFQRGHLLEKISPPKPKSEVPNDDRG